MPQAQSSLATSTGVTAPSSSGVSNGLASLGVSLDPKAMGKVTATYSGMAPMERFVAETCDGKGRVRPSSGQSTSTCQGTRGSK